MPRERRYASDTDRQRAYRNRSREQEREDLSLLWDLLEEALEAERIDSEAYDRLTSIVQQVRARIPKKLPVQHA